MSIYTKRGDKGRTDLFSGERVEKDSERVEAYGTIDELNAFIGRATATTPENDLVTILEEIQNHLHICQADLSNKTGDEDDYPRVTEDKTAWLEDNIDLYQQELPELKNFILQGGSEDAADLFVARAVCRRAERRLVHLSEREDFNPELLRYINRLGDLLFVMARLANHRHGMDEKHPDY